MNTILILTLSGLLSTNLFYVEVFGCKMRIPEGFYLSEQSIDSDLILFYSEIRPKAETWGSIAIQNHPEITQSRPSEAGLHELRKLEIDNPKLEAYDFTLRYKETNRVMLEQLIIRDDKWLVLFHGDAIKVGKQLLEDCR